MVQTSANFVNISPQNTVPLSVSSLTGGPLSKNTFSNSTPILTHVQPTYHQIHRSWIYRFILITFSDHFSDYCFRDSETDHPYKVQHTWCVYQIDGCLIYEQTLAISSCCACQFCGFHHFLYFIQPLLDHSAEFNCFLWDFTSAASIASSYSGASSWRVVSQYLINISDTALVHTVFPVKVSEIQQCTHAKSVCR